MYAKTAAIILGAMAAMGSASPVASPAEARDAAANSTAPGTLASQAITHLFVCTDANFKGRCENLETFTGSCTNLFNGFSDSITSLGPDPGATCTIWDDADCRGASVGGIIPPGIFNLIDFNFNDRASSYRCN